MDLHGPSFDLLIRYAEKRKLAKATEYEGGEVDYDEADSSSPKGFTTRIVRLVVEINYNLWTIKADSIRYDSRKATLSARGNVVVTHPEQAFKAKSILLDLRTEIMLDVVGRSSIARREALNKIKAMLVMSLGSKRAFLAKSVTSISEFPPCEMTCCH